MERSEIILTSIRAVPGLLRRLDPRIVRVTDPGRPPGRGLIAVLLVTGLTVAGAAAIAATGRDSRSDRHSRSDDTLDDNSRDLRKAPISPGTSARPSPNTEELVEARRASIAKRPKNFYDPIYVFTDAPALVATAYPLADPPGLVVNIEGIPEPEAAAQAMVGQDDRIKAVRRRVTANGVRYIIKLSTPVRRIETVHEGNVVMIAPLM